MGPASCRRFSFLIATEQPKRQPRKPFARNGKRNFSYNAPARLSRDEFSLVGNREKRREGNRGMQRERIAQVPAQNDSWRMSRRGLAEARRMGGRQSLESHEYRRWLPIPSARRWPALARYMSDARDRSAARRSYGKSQASHPRHICRHGFRLGTCCLDKRRSNLPGAMAAKKFPRSFARIFCAARWRPRS